MALGSGGCWGQAQKPFGINPVQETGAWEISSRASPQAPTEFGPELSGELVANVLLVFLTPALGNTRRGLKTIREYDEQGLLGQGLLGSIFFLEGTVVEVGV